MITNEKFRTVPVSSLQFNKRCATDLANTLRVVAPDMLYSCGDWATS